LLCSRLLVGVRGQVDLVAHCIGQLQLLDGQTGERLSVDSVLGFAGEFDALVSVLAKFIRCAHDPTLGSRTGMQQS
jgi:hypothetical protein